MPTNIFACPLYLLLAITYLFCASVEAAPVAVANFSFESPALAVGASSTVLSDVGWVGGLGNNGAALIESAAGVVAADTPGVGNNRNYLAVNLNYDVWQDSTTVFTAGMTYSLRVAVGHRTGQTNTANNLSVFGIADATTGEIVAAGEVNAGTTVVAGTFAEGAPVITHVPPGSPLIGRRVRLLLQARGGIGVTAGGNRSHFDNVRLDVEPTPSDQPGVNISAATDNSSTGATVNGLISQIGSDAPVVTVYWGLQDGGREALRWGSAAVLPGTQSGALALQLSTLLPGRFYYCRCRATNSAGTSWSSLGTFSTGGLEVKNFSFEESQNVTTGVTAINNDGLAWLETGGFGNAGTYLEYSAGLSGAITASSPSWTPGVGNNRQYLVQNLNNDSWQLTPHVYEVGKVYTLRVALGHRSGQTSPMNSSQYGLADEAGLVYDVQARNASTLTTADTFADGIAVVHVPPGSSAIGKKIRINLQARGSGRSHWDHVRLERADMDPSLPGVVTLAATEVGATGATLRGSVTQVGGEAPVVTFFYGLLDGGADPARWLGVGSGSAVVSGPQSGPFAATISGQLPSTAYVYRVRAVNAAGTTWSGPVQAYITTVVPPSVVNSPASKVLASAATLGGSVTGGALPNTVRIYYGIVDGGTTMANWSDVVTFGQQAASFSRSVTGLMANQRYHFRAAATNGGGTGWAPMSGSFMTAAASLPAITSTPATAVTPTSARLNCSVTGIGNDPPAVRIYYGLSDGGTVPANWASNTALGLLAGKGSVTVAGLTSGALYYFRAAASNAIGTVWGETLTFRAQLVTSPEVATREVRHLSSTFATLRGEVVQTGEEAPLASFYWGTADGGTVPGDWQQVAEVGVDGGSFERVILGLVPGTTYFFRAFARNSAGGSWAASSESFRTLLDNATSSLVINEIFFDSINPTFWTEFVEIFNPTTTTINLSGWSLTGSLRYTFGNVTIAAGDYMVVVQSPTSVTPAIGFDAAYGTICPPAKRVGPWMRDGVISSIQADHSLGNRSGLIRLRDPQGRVVDEVDYQSGFPWPTASKGSTFPITTLTHRASLSASLQHRDLDNALGASWRASIASPGNANFAAPLSPTNTTPAAPATAATLPPAIRDVETLPKQPMAGQSVRITAVVTDPDGVASVALQYQPVDPGNYLRKTDPAYLTTWTNLPMLDDGSGGDAYAGDSLFSVTIPPAVQTHRRLVRYRIIVTDSLTNTITVPYRDDEQLNFAYFVYNSVPAWQGALRPTAFNVGGFVPPTTPVETFPPALLNTIPPFHLIAVATDVNNSQYNSANNGARFNACLVYDGTVYDHIQFGNRGIGSTYNTGKNKWAVFFNRARNLEMRDNWGSKFDSSWNSLAMNANAYPWAAVFRGGAGIEECAAYRAFELAGVPSLKTTYAHWRVIDAVAEVGVPGTTSSDASFGVSGDGQYAGDFWGLYTVLEPMESNFLQDRGLADGSIYSIETTGINANGADKRHQGATQISDPTVNSEWLEFRNAASLGASAATGRDEAWYRANVDLDSLFTFMAISRLVGNVDVRPGDNWRVYRRPTDRRWVTMPYDLDMMSIAAHHWGGTMDNVAVAGAPLTVRAMMRFPAIARDYRNRCREILSLLASDASPRGGQIGQLLDEYAQMVNPAGQVLTWADADAAMWNLHPRSTNGGSNSGQNNAKGNFYRSFYADGTRGGLGGTSPTGTWIRQLNDADGDGFSDHEGILEFFTNFSTNTYPPTAPAWLRKATGSSGGGTDPDLNRQRGYGYKYLEWETLFGGWFNSNVNPPATSADVIYPNTPTATYTGTPGFPANTLTFTSTSFSAPAGGGSVAAVQFRFAEISAPGLPGYDPTIPRKYELEQKWGSGELAVTAATNMPTIRVPATEARVGSTYRVRVRHKDSMGRCSFWSEPIEFIAAIADVSVYQSSLVVSEYNYHPAAASSEEVGLGFTDDDFEYIELHNISANPLSLADVRFTKGVDFDFPFSILMAPQSYRIIVRNELAFRHRNPSVPRSLIAGVYGPDRLSDSGEELKLSFGAGQEIKSFTYAATHPGPASANGNGRSVMLRDRSSNPAHAIPGNWTASENPGGSPGFAAAVTYATWAAASSTNLNPLADDDADTVINLLEFALGGNPKDPTDRLSQLPTIAYRPLMIGISSNSYLTISYTIPHNRSGINYRGELSTDLQSWVTPAVLLSEVENANGTTTYTFRSPQPAIAQAKWFARLKVTSF